ncbi:MAG: hypothetical protein AAFR21_14590 [Pseudomonadota bacterium]
MTRQTRPARQWMPGRAMMLMTLLVVSGCARTASDAIPEQVTQAACRIWDERRAVFPIDEAGVLVLRWMDITDAGMKAACGDG